MDSETLAAEVHAIKVDLIALGNDLTELLRLQRDTTEFITLMQAIVGDMSTNPMLKAFLPAGFGQPADMPKLPGM